jgi:hypothetical protein
MKFHSDERSLDMTRRRRWHREMIPDTFLFHQTITDHSNEGIISNTDVVFRMQSKIDQQQTDLTPTKIKDIKIELNAPRIFLSFKSKFFFLIFIKSIYYLGAYYYELRAYIYQARNLLSMDHDGFSGKYIFLLLNKVKFN